MASATIHDFDRAENFDGKRGPRLEKGVTAAWSLGGSMPGRNTTRP
jgi:hypothetical protein